MLQQVGSKYPHYQFGLVTTQSSIIWDQLYESFGTLQNSINWSQLYESLLLFGLVTL